MAMSPLRVQVSPLSGTIYAGRINKEGNAWSGSKTDVTSDVFGCIIQKIGAGNFATVVASDGKKYEIEVREVAA